jgi:predicted 2-oxoglutarate/Fe(II)-dependent dioxygenase YbiX
MRRARASSPSVVAAALERHPLFLSAALPARIYPPMFNRYDGDDEMQFGTHVDGAVRLVPRHRRKDSHRRRRDPVPLGPRDL